MTASSRLGCSCSRRCQLCFRATQKPRIQRFLEAGGIAERFGDSDATMFARLGRGQSLILRGRITEGMALLDEVMVAVTADEVSPILAGIAYCQVIALCQKVFDLRRAGEWTEALSRWCDSQSDLVPYRGNCLVHRCEIFQLQGAWHEALEAAQQACKWLSGPPPWDSLGSAYYQLGEIQRLRGEFADAEDSYRKASLAGREPEPGMSLLRLTQRRIDLALPAIRRVLEEATGYTSFAPKCCLHMSRSCSRPTTTKQHGRRPMNLPGSLPISTRRICMLLRLTLPVPSCCTEGDSQRQL